MANVTAALFSNEVSPGVLFWVALCGMAVWEITKKRDRDAWIRVQAQVAARRDADWKQRLADIDAAYRAAPAVQVAAEVSDVDWVAASERLDGDPRVAFFADLLLMNYEAAARASHRPDNVRVLYQDANSRHYLAVVIVDAFDG
jgi:hypothetical protein